MIFPYDVNKVVINSRKIAGQNKVQAVIVVFVLGGVALVYVTDMLLGNLLGTGFGITLLIDFFILLVIGFLAFRFIIFDEDAKKREYEGAEGDSFAKYLFLRKDVHLGVDIEGEKATIFEFINGSSMAVMELRFGSNDDEKARATREIYERILHAPSSYGIETRVIIGPENFRTSSELRSHVNALNKIVDKDAARVVMEIDDAIVEQSYKDSNVDIIYLMMRTNSNYQRFELEIVMKNICSLLGLNRHALRSYHYLDKDELMEFFREFYGIDAIDLSMMRAMDLAEQSADDFSSAVQLYQFRTESGKVFTVEKNVIKGSAREWN